MAPIDPGTYEGGWKKPEDKQMNKWCARECERSSMFYDDKAIILPNFSKRIYNIKGKQNGK